MPLTAAAVTRPGASFRGAAFRRVESAWVAGVAAMARAGVGAIIDDAFPGRRCFSAPPPVRAGRSGSALGGCVLRPRRAATREAGRADRVAGMAASRAEMVHRGVVYDLEVDTSGTATWIARGGCSLRSPSSDSSSVAPGRGGDGG
ncbi:hypothetical protein [Modestobacter sp. DSM 44400]|uniref:phosphotransferase-like protein n=1 Tax=Modestobacter sp. DSM 44400 TaxID=1550230 RepID=UPI000B830E52